MVAWASPSPRIDSLGDDRDSVVTRLQELLTEIQNKLGGTSS